MLEKGQDCALINIKGFTNCLEVLPEGDIRHGVLAREGLVLHLHVSLLGHIVKFVCNIMVVREAVLSKPLDILIDNIAKQFIHWSNDC